MKKIFLAFILCLCAFSSKAQNYVEFLGLRLNGSPKTAFAEKLIEKGYTYHNEMDGYVMYKGQFLGVDAFVILAPSEIDDYIGTAAKVRGRG